MKLQYYYNVTIIFKFIDLLLLYIENFSFKILKLELQSKKLVCNGHFWCTFFDKVEDSV